MNNTEAGTTKTTKVGYLKIQANPPPYHIYVILKACQTEGGGELN